MWLLTTNGPAYLLLNTSSSRLGAPIPSAVTTRVVHELAAALRGRLHHDDPTAGCNAVQRTAYLLRGARPRRARCGIGARCCGSGCSFQLYANSWAARAARRVHFFTAMAALVTFITMGLPQ